MMFFLARLGIYFIHRESFADLNTGDVLFGFLHGIRFDLASLMVFLGLPLLISIVPLSWSRTRWWSGSVALVVFLLLLTGLFALIGDLIYFGFVKRHLSNELLFLPREVGYLAKEVSGHPAYLVTGVLLISAGGCLWKRILMIPLKPARRHLVKFVLFFMFVGIAGRGGIGMKPLAIVHAYAHGSSSLGNLTLNGIFSASHSMLLSENIERRDMNAAELEHALNLPADILDKPFPLEHDHRGTGKPGRNLVILMVESLTPKYVDGFSGGGYGITPNLDRMASRGWKFTRFYAHGQRSVEGIQAILTGLPSVMGLPAVTDLTANYSKLAELARDNGYYPLFVNSTEREAFLTREIAGSVGFSNYYGKEDMPLLLNYPDKEWDRRLGWDYETLMFTLEQIKKQGPPFLAFVSLTTDHTPYPRLMEPFTRYPHHPNREGGYLNSLHYTDWAIGEFINAAQSEPWFAETVFVITADHVIAHFQSGGFEENFRIPLILYAPEILTPRQVNTVGSQLDLAPTFVSLMGLSGRFSTIGNDMMHRHGLGAWVREGSVVGIISELGYVKHSLSRMLDSGSWSEPEPPADYFEKLELRLLAMDRLAYDLIRENRWGR